MLLAALFIGVFAFGETFTDGSGLVWTYTISSGKATLSGVAKEDSTAVTGTLSVPSTVGGATVTAIAANSFQDLEITGLNLPSTLKTIAYGAFANCTSLEALTLPDSLTTLGGSSGYSYRDGAFSGCTALKSVHLGSGLVTIGDGYAESIDDYAHTGVFGNCSSLETVEFNQGLVKIGHHAFSRCIALKSVTLPDSVQTIGINCFYDNIRLTRVLFGADLQLIDQCAFMGCVSLNSVSFSPATTPLLTIKSNAFRNCLCLASLTLPNSIPTIASGAFSGCTMLRSITIPSLMSTISSGVFSTMSNLREVTFLGLPPENIENAGLATDVKIRYPREYAEDWATVIAAAGFTNTEEIDPTEYIGLLTDSRYGISPEPGDRSIASITIDSNVAIDSFILTDGKVYDSVLRIVNTANQDVSLTLPSGYVYETFEGANPLTIPANSRNILTITRTAADTFLVSREKLRVLE